MYCSNVKIKGLNSQQVEILMLSKLSTGVDSAGTDVDFEVCLCGWLEGVKGCALLPW